MKLIGLNILLYAVNEDSPHHGAIRAWWEEALNGDESLGLPWVALLGFLRISTNRDRFPRPLDSDTAADKVHARLSVGITTLVPERRSIGRFFVPYSERLVLLPISLPMLTWPPSQSAMAPFSSHATMTSRVSNGCAGRTR